MKIGIQSEFALSIHRHPVFYFFLRVILQYIKLSTSFIFSFLFLISAGFCHPEQERLPFRRRRISIQHMRIPSLQSQTARRTGCSPYTAPCRRWRSCSRCDYSFFLGRVYSIAYLCHLL